MKKKLYNSPSMEVHALKVERGFAGSDSWCDYSGTSDGNENFDSGDPYNPLG